MRKILVTGGSGFIGWNLTRQLKKDYHVISPSSKELDLLASESVYHFLQTHPVDVVIHAATHNATITSKRDKSQILRNNLLMFFHLARAQTFYKRLISLGSGAEYNKDRPLVKVTEEEFDKVVPTSDYGVSKYIIAKHIESSKKMVNLRLFGCFGPYEDWRIRFISFCCCCALYDMPIIISQNAKFDYVFIDDFSTIISQLIELESIPHKHYNISNFAVVDLVSLAKMVIKISGKKINYRVSKSGLKGEYSGDNSRLVKTLNKVSFTPHEEAIRKLYHWYKDHKKDIDPAKLRI